MNSNQKNKDLLSSITLLSWCSRLSMWDCCLRPEYLRAPESQPQYCLFGPCVYWGWASSLCPFLKPSPLASANLLMAQYIHNLSFASPRKGRRQSSFKVTRRFNFSGTLLFTSRATYHRYFFKKGVTFIIHFLLLLFVLLLHFLFSFITFLLSSLVSQLS